jgi:hypothetical protein
MHATSGAANTEIGRTQPVIPAQNNRFLARMPPPYASSLSVFGMTASHPEAAIRQKWARISTTHPNRPFDSRPYLKYVSHFHDDQETTLGEPQCQSVHGLRRR